MSSTSKKKANSPNKFVITNEMKRDPKLRRKLALAESLFNVKYDKMEFNDLLDDDSFVQSYNNSSKMKGLRMQPKVMKKGCYFEL